MCGANGVDRRPRKYSELGNYQRCSGWCCLPRRASQSWPPTQSSQLCLGRFPQPAASSFYPHGGFLSESLTWSVIYPGVWWRWPGRRWSRGLSWSSGWSRYAGTGSQTGLQVITPKSLQLKLDIRKKRFNHSDSLHRDIHSPDSGFLNNQISHQSQTSESKSNIWPLWKLEWEWCAVFQVAIVIGLLVRHKPR